MTKSNVDKLRMRRTAIVAVVFLLLPAIVFTGSLIRRHAPAQVWVITGFGYALLAVLVLYSARSGARSVMRLSAEHADALFVRRALDPAVRPIGVRVLVVDPHGLRLCGGRAATRTAWTVPWTAVSSAAIGEATTRTGTSTAVVVTLRDGGVKTLRLPSRFGLSSDRPASYELESIVNRNVGPHLS